jgi:malonyl-CoA O-methyltransferase
LRQWHAALAVDGYVMFSCLGPDSLQELRHLYAQNGWPPPSHSFTDMHDWGDLLVQAGFAEPVMDMERITLTYPDASAVLADLRDLGRNLSPSRHPVCRSRAWGQGLQQAMASPDSPLLSTQAGRLKLTFEVIYGHAFKPTPRARVASKTEVPLQDLKAMLGRRPTRD